MLSWTLTFLVIALIAAILGFGVLAGTAVYIAKVIFLVFLVMFVISFLMYGPQDAARLAAAARRIVQATGKSSVG